MLPDHRLNQVEVLRGLAAFAVAWFHFTQGGSLLPQDSWLRLTGQHGYLGVEAFFVISGFIIPHAMCRRGYVFPRDAWAFAARRVIRLEPAYIASVALVIVLWRASAAVSPTAFPMPEGLASVALAHAAYLAPWFGMPWLSPVYWSLAIEFQYYCFILVLAPLLIAHNPWRVRAFLALVMALSFVTADGRVFLFYLPLFGLGFLRFLLGASVLPRSEVVGWISAMSTLAFARLSVPMVCAGLIALAMLWVRMPARVPHPLLFLGTISYSLYLLHVPIGGRVINLAARLPQTWYVQALGLAAAVLISVLAAYLFYRAVERPTADWSHRVGSRKAPVHSPVA
jgi:peptidoglycan/LPS O-acetylase OafA/YrhL